MNIIPELATLSTPTFILTSFIIGVFIIWYFSNLLIKKYPKGKHLIYPGAVFAIILLLYPYFHLAYPCDTFICILKALISVPLIFFIPGFLTFNAFGLKECDLKFSETIFVQVLISIVMSSLFSMFLAEVGFFSLINLILLLLGFCIILSLAKKTTLSLFPRPKLNYEAISLISILVLTLVLLIVFPPAEWVIGTFDAGVHVNDGANIARTGSIVTHDPLISMINRDNILINHATHGFYLTDTKSGESTHSGYHMFPVWVAIFYSIFGIWGTVYVAPFFGGVMGIISVFMVGRLITNWEVATIGSLFLSLNYAQIFFSHTPYTQVMVQYFMFSALFTFILYKKFSSNKFAIISAITFAITMLVRIDSFILLIPFFAYYLYLKTFGKMKNCDVVFANTFLAVSIYSTLHTMIFSFAMFQAILGYMFGKFIHYQITLGLVNIVFYLLILIQCVFLVYFNFSKLKSIFGVTKKIKIIEKVIQYINKIIEEVDQYINRNEIAIRYVLSFSILIFVIYNWLIRPQNMPFISNACNMLKLSLCLTPLVLICGIGGLLLLINTTSEKGNFYFIGIFLLFFIIFIIDACTTGPYFPWIIRRYLTVVIPSLMICAGYFIYKISELLPRKKLFRQLVIILIISLVAFNYVHLDDSTFEDSDGSILKQRMWAGMIDCTEQISDLVGEDIIIFGDGPNKIATPGRLLASPLKYIYGKNVIFIDDRDKDDIIMILRTLNNASVELYGEDKKIYLTQFNNNITNISKRAPDISFVEVDSFNIPLTHVGCAPDKIPEMNSFTRCMSIFEVKFNVT